jgi:hypothetical protein
MQTQNSEIQRSQHTDLVGAVAALLIVLIFRRYLSAEFAISNGFGIFFVPNPLPVTPEDWFKLILSDPLVGLLLLDFFDIVNYILVGIVFYALSYRIRQSQEKFSNFALGIGIFGILVHLISNSSVKMFLLSLRYSTATEITKMELILAGENILQNDNLGFGINLGLFLVLTSGLVFSILMLKDSSFGKVTPIFGLLANGIGLLYFPVLLLAPNLIWLPPTVEALFRMVWNIFMSVDFIKLERKPLFSSNTLG